ncbi:hypothetical protein GGU10DRAFT_334510 [Lentinula aff. detonsa]|uniref:DUF6697 domain-containing protein n=1 Tax=Lentinula aff. detonsa TaxID=2804958 RepID=A0AA38L4M4_9AGAR|nr:hypothetical protein GGU10DRAFT_334510 [Lentinula aff. detonsa]
MSNVFGGVTEPTFLTIKDRGAWPQRFPKDYDPVAPTEPGSPGLFFTHDKFWFTNVNSTAKDLEDAGRPRPDWESVNRVLTCLSNDNWLFIGQYEVSFYRALSLSEWKNLSQKSILVWTMACVEYDADFQLRLATESSPMKQKGKKDPTKSEKNRENIIRKSRTRERKRSEDESSNSDSDSDYTLSGQFGKDSRSLGLESNYQVRR